MKKPWKFVALLLLCALCGNHLLLKAQAPRREVAFTIDDLPMAGDASIIEEMQAVTRRSLSAFGLLGVVCALAQEQTKPTSLSPAEREARWREDLQFLVAGLSAPGNTVDFRRGISTRGQKDFEKLYPKASFDAEIKALGSDISKLPDAEVALRLARLMASAHVAHNLVQIRPRNGFFARLPLTFSWFADGLAVTGASPDYSAALGTRVLKIGTMTPEQLLSAVTPYISHENDVWLRVEASSFIRWAAVLSHFGMIDADRGVLLTLEKPGGAPFTLSVAPADPRVKTETVAEGLHVAPPLFLSRPGEYYWYQYLSDSQTLYIQYNACANDPKLSFSDFAKQALAEADAHPVKRVVIDLRHNGGGDSRVIGPLKSGLAARLQAIGHVYVLIGPLTFSSAVDNASELRHSLHATLVGEKAGETPDGYGEVKFLTLPNSKLVVQYTSKFSEPGKESDALTPDVEALRKLADALAGRDPALEAAIAASP